MKPSRTYRVGVALAVAGLPRPEYILFSDLTCHCESMCRFGSGAETLKKVSRRAG